MKGAGFHSLNRVLEVTFFKKGVLTLVWIACRSKESYSRVNGSKQQLSSFIIYDLDSIARVNERKKKKKKVKLTKKRKVELPGLELTAGEVFRSCQSWMLYHCATKLRHLLWQIIMNINYTQPPNIIYLLFTISTVLR